jgi:hypothetical protein
MLDMYADDILDLEPRPLVTHASIAAAVVTGTTPLRSHMRDF